MEQMFEHFNLLFALLFGAVVSSDFLASTLSSFRALFRNEFLGALAYQGWKELAVPMDSSGEVNEYAWFGTVPKMQDVTQDTVPIGGLGAYSFTIRNREYQAAVEVSRMAFERDQLGLITPRIAQMAQEAARHPSELVFDLMEANPLAYDGLSFFNDNHPVGTTGTVYDNLLAGAGITIANLQTDLGQIRQVMRLFKDDRGRVMNQIPRVIVVPPALEMPMWQALNPGGSLLDRQVVPASEQDILNGSGYTLIVNPRLTDVTDWYAFANGGPSMRPFIFQTEKAPVLESDTNPETREAIVKRTFLYSAYGRYAVGVSEPRLGVKVVNAG